MSSAQEFAEKVQGRQEHKKMGAMIRAQGMMQQPGIADLLAQDNCMHDAAGMWGGGAGVYYASAPAQAATYNAANLTVSGKI